MSTPVEKLKEARSLLHRAFAGAPGSADHLAALGVAALLRGAIDQLTEASGPATARRNEGKEAA